MINKLKEAISKFYSSRFSVEYETIENDLVYNFHFCDGTYFSLTDKVITERNFGEILDKIDHINDQKRKMKLIKDNDPEFYQELMKNPKMQEQEEIINRYEGKLETH